MANSKAPNKVAPTRSLLDLSWEELFAQPVSLTGLELEDEFDIDHDDYSFLLDLDFETLFSTPLSVQRFQESLEESAAGEEAPRDFDIPNRSGSQQNLNVNHVDAPIRVKSNPIDTKSNNTSSSTDEETEVPPVFEQPTEQPTEQTVIEQLPVESFILNESDVFVSEGSEVTTNLFDLAGLEPEDGVVIEIFGVTNNGFGDVGESSNFIAVNTEHGHIDVNVNTGQFWYEYVDASSVPDEQQSVTEQVPYKVELFSDGLVLDHALNVIIDLNQAPIALDDTYQINADATLIINTPFQSPFANDTDPDNTETFTDLMFLTKINGDNNIFSGYIYLDEGGAVNVSQGGTFNFNPGEDFLHLAPGDSEIVTFSYTIQDGEGLESTANVSIEVMGVEPPQISFPIDEIPLAIHAPSQPVLQTHEGLTHSDIPQAHTFSVHLPELDFGGDVIHPEFI